MPVMPHPPPSLGRVWTLGLASRAYSVSSIAWLLPTWSENKDLRSTTSGAHRTSSVAPLSLSKVHYQLHPPFVLGHLIGGLCNCLLFGALLAQTYIYYVCFPKDSPRIKSVVYTLFRLMLLRLCFNAVNLHHWFCSGFGHTERFQKHLYVNNAQPVLGCLSVLLVQMFSAYRIFALKRTAWPFSALVLLVNFHGASCRGTGSLDPLVFWRQRSTGPVHALFGQFVRVWLASAVIADVITVTTITYLLLMATVERRTQNFVADIIWLTIEANTFSAALTVAGLILFYLFPVGTSYWVIPTTMLPGMSANSFLATLNHRALARRDSTELEPFLDSVEGSVTDLDRENRLVRSTTFDSIRSITEMTFAPRNTLEISRKRRSAAEEV
ncbi:hypothetical protein C8R43DRAFT_1118870 [Mycena crocata]|nr:hypothetical protein C8R43DRAFT_1118870 [Mycena crocata]